MVPKKTATAVAPWLLVFAALAGCTGGNDTAAQEIVCDDDDLVCQCEGDQFCIDQGTDSDGDGLNDADEKSLGTNLTGTDSDGDGFSDGEEVEFGWPPLIPYFPGDGAFVFEDVELTSELPHQIHVSVFKPANASADRQYPVLLQSHGFTGARWTEAHAETIETYVKAGFGVVSFDERGHGDARDDSTVTFMHPSAEVLDVIQVIDYISEQDWVLKELDNSEDPVLGTIGRSYGGAFQLMGSVFDDRIDAMVPEITWHNIVEALAPNGAIKSGWVDVFYAAGTAQGSVRFSDDFNRGFAYATSTNELPEGQAPGVPDLVTLFKEASPEFHQPGLDVPTLLIQGMPDTLFPLNQAVWNFERIQQNGAEVQLYTHLGGHILHTGSLAPTSPAHGGIQGAPGGAPCGGAQDLEILWHTIYLHQLPYDAGPKVCLALEDETAIVGDTWPLESTVMELYEIPGPIPIAQGGGGGTRDILATITADDEMVVAGIPRLSGSMTMPGADAILYFSFQTALPDGSFEHIVDDQVRPLRVKGPNQAPVDFDIELGGIATRLAAGEEMQLIVSSVEAMYMGNSERVPSGVILEDLTLTLPVVTEPQSFELPG